MEITNGYQNGIKFPDIYVMSKLPNLIEEIKKFLPEDVKLIDVPVRDKRIRYDKSVSVSAEEVAMVEDAEVLVVDSMLLSKMLYRLPKLKFAQNTWTGVEMIFDSLDKARPKPSFRLSRYVSPYFGELMANYIVAQVINIERGLYTCYENRKEEKWVRPYFPNFRVVSDLSVGVLGAGQLGSTVGRQLRSLGAKVLLYVKTNTKREHDESMIFTTNLTEVLESCDYICNVLPSTEETIGLLDGSVLKNCKRKPVFINIGRGDIAKEETIIEALNNGWISKAVLDVFEQEPLPEASLLWKIPSVIITPHIGAIPHLTRLGKYIAENYLNYVSRKPLQNEVDWSKGY